MSTDSELPTRYAEASRLSHDDHVLAEQFLPGPALTVEGFKTSNGHYSLAVSRKKGFAHNPMVASELVYSPAAEDMDFTISISASASDRTIRNSVSPNSGAASTNWQPASIGKRE